MFKIRQVSLLTGFLLGLFMCSQSFAAGSGAYRVDMPDARALGMGGAFVAVADSPAAVYYNPAGMTQLKESQIAIGTALLQPKAHAEPDGGTKTKMQQQSFFVPNLFSVTKLSEKIALGVGVTSIWGLGTEWAQDSFAHYVSTRTQLENKDYLVSMAYKLNEQFSFGAGVVIDDSKIERQKKIAQFGIASDGNFKLVGKNASAGFQVSGVYKINERHQFGVQYSSEIRRKYHGKVHLDGLDDTALTLYGVPSGSFPNSSYETDVVSKATLPQSVDLGYSYRPTEKLMINADVLWMDWAAVKEEELGYPNETNGGRIGFLNQGNPANRDWHSAISFALGTEYKFAERLRLRAGYYFHQSPGPQDTWDTSLPDANSQAVATGFGYDITKALTFDLAYSAMFYDTRSIKNAVGDSVGGSIDAKYSQWVNLVSATATYKF